jgi:hypothetical protein
MSMLPGGSLSATVVRKQPQLQAQTPVAGEEITFLTPHPEPTILDRMERIARKVHNVTIQPDVQAVMLYLTTMEMEIGLKAEIHKTDMASIRPDAVRTLKENAKGWRSEVEKDLVIYLVDAIKQGKHVTRGEMKTKAGSLCAYRNFKGKNKQRIQDTTIDKWLTIDLENQIRNEAAQLLSADSSSKGKNRS